MHASAHGDGQPSRWRTRLVVGGLAAIWILLAARLVQLQWLDRGGFADMANRQRSFAQTIPARPGDIVDRHGRLLATTVTSDSLFVVPDRIAKPWQVAFQLAEALDLEPDHVFQRLSENRSKKFLWIKRRLTDAEAGRIRQLDLPQLIWGFRNEYLRYYPQGRLAVHVLGLRNIDGKGRGGIEQQFDSELKGRNGRRLLVRDARGRVIDVLEDVEVPPQDGRTVVLSLDSVVQVYAEQELDRLIQSWRPRAACAIVMDPKNGDVLALASRPDFDPNNPTDVADAAWKNNAVASVYEPGSTMKPLITAWALESGVVQPGETFDCENGEYRMGRRVLHDHHPYGVLSLTDVLVKSSNIGMAKIGERLGKRRLYNAIRAFGFGLRTGIPLPGELPGLVRPLDEWNSYSIGSIPIGQEIAVTPLQMTVAHCALANRGRLVVPRLVLGTSSGDGADVQADEATYGVVSKTVDAQAAQWIVTGPLTDVVRRGTGKRASLDDYSVFGKTGTAQKLDPATGGYAEDRHVVSFLCGAPAGQPRVVVFVLVDEPTVGRDHTGGRVAAPAASKLLRRTLVHLRVPSNDEKLAQEPADGQSH